MTTDHEEIHREQSTSELEHEPQQRTATKRKRSKINYNQLHTGKTSGKKNKPSENRTKGKDNADHLKRQLKEAKKENKQLQKAIDLKGKIITNLEEKITIKDRQIDNLNQDVHQNKQEEEILTSQNEELHENNERQQREIEQLQKQNEELKKHNDELKRRLNTITAAPRPDRKIMIIGDSNTKYIKEQLINMSNIEIHHLHAFTLEQAEELTTTIQDKDFNNTTTYLLVGTNNIKKGESAKDCAAKHKAITEKIKNITQDLVIIQLPPIYCRDYRKQREMDREIIRMNTILEERHQNIISTQFMEQNRNLIQQDGLHLTNQAAIDIATAIMQSAHPTGTSPTQTPRTITTQQEEMKITIHQNQQQDQQEEEIEVIETSYRGAAIVIGAKGNRVRLLKAKYNVEIDREKLEGGEYALIIRGKTEDTKRARLEINNIIKEETQRRPQERTHQTNPNNFTYNTTCRFFKMGMCNRGNQCKYLHTNDPVDISPRTPDRHQQEEQHTTHYPTTPETTPERRRERTPERRHHEEYHRRHQTRTPERRRHHTPENNTDRRQDRRQQRTPERRRYRTPERRNDRQRTRTPSRHERERTRTPPRRHTPERREHRHHQETSRYRSNSPHSHTSNRNRSESSTSRPSTYRSQETYHRNRTPHRTEDRAHHRHQTRSRSPLNLDKLDNIIDQLQEVRRKKTQ